jgi:hypothetical protein
MVKHPVEKEQHHIINSTVAIEVGSVFRSKHTHDLLYCFRGKADIDLVEKVTPEV